MAVEERDGNYIVTVTVDQSLSLGSRARLVATKSAALGAKKELAKHLKVAPETRLSISGQVLLSSTTNDEAKAAGNRHTATFSIPTSGVTIAEEPPKTPAQGAAETVESKQTAGAKSAADEKPATETKPSGAPPGSPAGDPLPHTPKPGEDPSDPDDPCADGNRPANQTEEDCREAQRDPSSDVPGQPVPPPTEKAEVADKPEVAAQMHALHQQGFLMRGLGFPMLIRGFSKHKLKGATHHPASSRELEPSEREVYGSYKSISVIGTDGSLRNPMQIKNLLRAKELAAEFLTLTNTQLSALVPKVRLFRVNYKLPSSRGVKDMTNPPAVDKENPETEFYFHSHIDAMGIGSLTSSRFSRGAGVGVKEFTWADKSTSPGDKGKRFESTLKLHFQSLDDLISSKDARAGNALEDPPSFLNLVVPPQFRATELDAKGKKVLSDDKYNPEFFQIKAIVGWSIPDGKLKDSLRFSDDQIEAIRNTQESFFLQLNRHNFDFAEDGSVELTVEYYATQEGMLDSGALDLFYISDDQIQAKLDSGLELDTSGLGGSTLEELKKKKAAETDSQKKHKIQGEINNLKTKAKKILVAEQHNSLIRILAEDSAIRSMKVRPHAVGMFQIDETDIPGALLGKDIRWKQRSVKGSAEDMLNAFKNADKNDLVCPDDANTTSKSSADFDILMKDVGKIEKEKKDDEIMEFAEKWKTEPKTSKLECVDVRYFFLGDLIDAACDKLLGSSASKKYRKSMFYKKFSIILGPITYVNPFRTTTEVDDDGVKHEVAMRETLSLADVPISFDLFRLWWMKTVIKPGLKSMTLKQFIEAIVGKLISPAIGPDAFGEAGKANIGAAAGMPSITLFNFPSPEGKSKIPIGQKSTLTQIRGSFGTGGWHKGQNEFYSVADSFYYLYISFISRDVKDLKGCYDHDTDNGIYHLSIGRDQGIVKNIKFKRSDFPGVKEHAMTRDESLGYQNLREPYDADVTLVGCTLFQSGDLVFLNPLTVGSGANTLEDRTDIMSRLMLGGYYVIINVDNTVSADGFETTFSAKNQGSYDITGDC